MKRFLHMILACALVLTAGVFAGDFQLTKHHQQDASFVITFEIERHFPAVLRLYPGDPFYDATLLIADRSSDDGGDDEEDDGKTVLV